MVRIVSAALLCGAHRQSARASIEAQRTHAPQRTETIHQQLDLKACSHSTCNAHSMRIREFTLWCAFQFESVNRQLTLCQYRRRMCKKKPQQRQNAAVSTAAPHGTPAGHRIHSAKQRMKTSDLQSIPTRSFFPSGTAKQSLYCNRKQLGVAVRCVAQHSTPSPAQTKQTWGGIFQIRLHTNP